MGNRINGTDRRDDTLQSIGESVIALNLIAPALNVAWYDGNYIYFLIFRGQLVYIGQTTDFLSRIAAHKKDGGKNFDRVAYLKIPDEFRLDDVERAFISLLRPVLNIQCNRNGATGYESELKLVADVIASVMARDDHGK